MPEYVQEPTGRFTRRTNAALTLTGTSSVVTALGDESDTTYGKASSATLPHDYETGWPTLGTGERIVSICPGVRSKQPGTKTVRAVLGWAEYRGLGSYYVSEAVALSLPTGVSSATDYETAAQNGQLVPPVNFLYQEWPATIGSNEVFVAFYDPHTSDANRALFYEAELHVYATEAATVANPTAPTGTVTTTQYPTCTATVSSIVESWQVPSGLPSFMCDVTIEWSVYSGSLTTPSGTALMTWETTETIDTYGDGSTPTDLACSTTPPEPIPNGAMTLFARVVREHPSGEYASAWSTYGYKQWTQSLTLPSTPTLTLTNSDVNQRVQVQVNAPTTTGYDSATGEVEVQRQLADGSWREVRGMTEEAITIGSTVTVGYDYEADRGVTNTYRARSSMWHTVDAVRRYSAWDTETCTGYAVSGWNLKAVETPASNWLNAPVLSDPPEISQAPSAVFEPVDGERVVVVLGALGGFSGSYEISCIGSTHISSLTALEAYRGIVYVEDAFGGEKYIAITKVGWVNQGTAAAPRRRATVEYAEISSGLAESAS